MKKHTLTILTLCLTFYSCQKGNSINSSTIVKDSGCIEWKIVSATDHSGYSINNTNISIINGLFLSNRIDNSKYRYHYFFEDSIQTYFPPYAKYDTKSVRVTEFTNGLEIYPGDFVFVFNNNILNFRDGNETKGTTLSTTPDLNKGQIRTLFLGHIEQYDHKGSQYKDSCFSAEFGYFNLNFGSNNATENLVKAWKITLQNRIYPSEYPIAYYQDADGKLIVYDNGIKTFK